MEKMKRYYPILLLPFILQILACKKKEENQNQTTTGPCRTCVQNLVSNKESDSVFFYIPTAFTPNGDGKNDLYRPVSKGIKDGSLQITIYDGNGNLIHTITNPLQGWAATDSKGKILSSGNYPVSISYETITGKKTEDCTCVAILAYQGNCIPTNGMQYYFEDQLGIGNGFIYQTSENLCK